MKIVFIGAGRVATHLAKALHKQAYEIVQVYSRTIESAHELASTINSQAITTISQIRPDADIYIFSVKDTVLNELLQQMPANNGLWLHTAGSLPLDIFAGRNNKYGVLYPFQTFSKNRELDFTQIPLFIEANANDSLTVIETIANQLSDKVFHLNSNKRQYLHLTGVFACNFVNHLYAISEEILKQEEIPFEILLPLIDETASKVHTLTPKDAQTGPAIRYDKNVIEKHLDMLDDPDLKNIYTIISEHIYLINNR